MAGDKNINIGVGADVSGLKTGLDDAAKSVKGFKDVAIDNLNNAAKSTDATFKSLSQAFRVTAKDAQQIAMAQGTTSQAFLEAAAKARDYKTQLDQVNAAIYAQESHPVPFQKATSGFNGLSNSVNQLTREMPAFTYSVQTGFMALSNNIPIFVDQINAIKAANASLAASGQPVQSVLSQIGAAVFSWNTALSLAITGITMFAPKLMEMATGTDAAAKSIQKAEKSLSDFNAEMERYLMNDNQNQIANENKKYDEFRGALDAYVQYYEAMQATMAAGGLKMDEASTARYRESKKQLEDIEKKHGENIQKIKDDFDKKDFKKSKDKLIEAAKLYIPEKTSFELENPFKELGGKQGIMKGNLLGDLPEQLKVAKIAVTEFVSSTDGVMNDWAEKNVAAFEKLEDAMINIGTNAFGQLGTMIGQSLGGAETNINKFFGGIADQLGSAMIAIGSAMLVGSAATAGATSPMAYGYLAGGFALKAVAGYLGSVGGNGSKSAGGSTGSSGGYSASNGFSGFTPQNNSMVLTTRLIGQDLLMSVQKAGQQNTRVR